MCLLPENEQFAAVDDTADWCEKTMRPQKHPKPLTLAIQLKVRLLSLRYAVKNCMRDFRVMWGGVDWFDVGTRLTAYLCAVVLLSAVLAIAIAHGWLDLPQLAAWMGAPQL